MFKRIVGSTLGVIALSVALTGCMGGGMNNNAGSDDNQPTRQLGTPSHVKDTDAPTPTPSRSFGGEDDPTNSASPDDLTNGMDKETAKAVLTYFPKYRDIICDAAAKPTGEQSIVDALDNLKAEVSADKTLAGTDAGEQFVQGLELISYGYSQYVGQTLTPDIANTLTETCTQATDVVDQIPSS